MAANYARTTTSSNASLMSPYLQTLKYACFCVLIVGLYVQIVRKSVSLYTRVDACVLDLLHVLAATVFYNENFTVRTELYFLDEQRRSLLNIVRRK